MHAESGDWPDGPGSCSSRASATSASGCGSGRGWRELSRKGELPRALPEAGLDQERPHGRPDDGLAVEALDRYPADPAAMDLVRQRTERIRIHGSGRPPSSSGSRSATSPFPPRST